MLQSAFAQLLEMGGSHVKACLLLSPFLLLRSEHKSKDIPKIGNFASKATCPTLDSPSS